MGLKPSNAVTRIELDGVQVIPPSQVSFVSVGEKAFGLSCLPKPWTLPFLVVSSAWLAQFRKAFAQSDRDVLVFNLGQFIRNVLSAVGVPSDGDIYVRSSAVSESLEERGRYHSVQGSAHTIELTLMQCLSALDADLDLQQEEVHLIVQQAVTPVSAKGHLSNERRCYEEARDWLGEFELPERKSSTTFPVNLRKWRSQATEYSEQQPLACNLEVLISKVLQTPAWWAKRSEVRVHFEWVWDGRRIFIVQADEAKRLDGTDPTYIPRTINQPSLGCQLKCLAPLDAKRTPPYNKIKNVLSYLALDLPIANLYVLDDPVILDAVRSGPPPVDLLADLRVLVTRSLVIRTDLATDDQNLRQLLPRTNEVRDVDSAIEFIKSTLQTLSEDNVTERVAFIFHNFIPAVSSAFAYAAPGQRKVLIESLWGLPEGLYYNAHDKFEVDTGLANLGNVDNSVVNRFRVLTKLRFKRNYVAPDEYGNWIPKVVAEPWDWRPSIRKDQWVKEIALASKRIAEHEDRAVSVMWFVEVPDWASQTPCFPWYHEPFDFSLVSKAAPGRRKTPFDRSLTIKTKADISALEYEATHNISSVRQVRIQPKEDDLLRNKELLKSIGDLTKAIGAVILLEGGTLSHAYYQLMQTHAIVEVVDPFEATEEIQEFNKLVRDNIPQKIHQGGESVRVTRLFGDQLLRVLREKLIEEAYEVLDASDHHSIIEELADAEEVIEGILKQLKAKRQELRERQKAKSLKAGGFEEGYVLLETRNPSPTHIGKESASLPLTFEADVVMNAPLVEQSAYPAPPSVIAKWSDRREHGSANERILNLVVSLVSDQWSAESPDISLGTNRGDVLRAKVQGKREGANLRLEISIFSPSTQLRLFED